MSASEAAGAGDEYPDDGAFEGCLKVLGEPSAAADPGEGAFDYPSAWQQLEAVFGGVRASDDLKLFGRGVPQASSPQSASMLF